MKKTRKCPKCESLRVGHLAVVLDKDDYKGTPRSLGVAVVDNPGFFSLPTVDRNAARVEAYICTDCGFFEEYVVHPERVPWTSLENFTLLNNPDGDPT